MTARRSFLIAAVLLAGGISTAIALTPAERCAAGASAGNIDACKAALAAQPEDIGLLRHLARAQIEAAQFDAAVTTFERVVAIRPDDPRAREDLAGTLGFIRQYERAAREMERALELRPPRAVDFRVLAIMYSHLNNPGRAADLTRMAADLGDPIAMFDLRGFYLDGLGVAKNLDTAVAWTERAAEAGHLGAMSLLTDIFLNGLYGQKIDEDRAVKWAERLRAQERNFQ